MKYKVLTSFKALTRKGDMQLQAGQIITLPKAKADSLIEQRKVKPLQHIMVERYKDFCKWLKSYPVTDVQIKQTMPEHYQTLQDAITEMDSHYYNENLQGFTEAMERVKGLCLEAVTFFNAGKEREINAKH